MFSLFRKQDKGETDNNMNQIKELTAFLSGTGPDRHNRYYSGFIGYTDKQLEYDHSYIQWVFPTETPSAVNVFAPVISRDQAKQLTKIEAVRENLHKMFLRMLLFYGISLISNEDLDKREDASFVVIRRDRRTTWIFHKRRVDEWLQEGNHNLLRISRMLECLYIFDKKEEYELLCKIVNTFAAYKPEIKEWACWSYWTTYMDSHFGEST